MDKRTLGTGGLEVSAIGLGCMGMTGGYSDTPDREEMIALLRAAVDRGVTFFDTAEIYGPYANEELVGEALAPYRDQVVIATKFGWDIDPVDRKPRGRVTSRPEHQQVVEGSLQRLGVDAIDLYYQHRVDPDVPDRGRRRRGQGAHRGRQGQALRPVRGGRRDDPPGARGPARHGRAERVLAVVAAARGGGAGRAARSSASASCPFSPLGKGFLTGTVTASTSFDAGNDIRSTIPRFTPDALEHNQAVVDLLASIAAAQGRHARPDRPGLAARPEALDRPDPRHPQAAPAGGEHRRRRHRAVGRRAHARSRTPRPRSTSRVAATARRRRRMTNL